MDVDQEFEDLKKRLQPFPNYFQLELQKVSRNTWKNVKQKLEAEEEEAHVCQSDMEKHRDKNLKACVYYELGDPEKAGRLIREVLNSSSNKNVNASAMMALIHYKNGMFAESDKILEQLETLKDSGDTLLIDKAFAEMAYGYSRIDARYYTKAIDLFEDVIMKRQSTQHKDFVFIWKFGLALTLRRCNHLDLRTFYANIDSDKTSKRADANIDSDKTSKRADELLIDIINNCRNDDYIAMACVERANLYSHFVDSRTHTDKQLVESLIKDGVNKAPNDPVILAKAGKLMRQICKFREAEEYLRKSVHIRETSLGLHHLGLFLKGKLKARQKREKNNSRGRGRGTGRGLWKSWSRKNSLVENPRTDYNSRCNPQFILPTSPVSRPPPRQTQRIKSVKPIRLFSQISTSKETSPQQNPELKDESKSDSDSKCLLSGSLAKQFMSDRQPMPKRGGFTLEDENHKGSSKTVLVNSSDNPIPEIKNVQSTVDKDGKLNPHMIVNICPELASLSLESKKAKDIISYHQVLDNSGGPSNVTHESTDIQPTMNRRQSDVLNLQTYAWPTAVDGSHKESLKVKCVINTKCDVEEDSEMPDICEYPYAQEIRLGQTSHYKYPEIKHQAYNEAPQKSAYVVPEDALCKRDHTEYKDIKSSSCLITPFTIEAVDSTIQLQKRDVQDIDATARDDNEHKYIKSASSLITPLTSTIKFQEKDVQDIDDTVIKEVISSYSDDTINKVMEVKSNQGKDLSDANKVADAANQDKCFDVGDENKTLTKVDSKQMDFKGKYPDIANQDKCFDVDDENKTLTKVDSKQMDFKGKYPDIARSSSLSPDAKSFVPSTKQPVACDTQTRYLRTHNSPIPEYGSPMGLFSRILKSPAHDQVAIYDKNYTYHLEECLTMFQKSYDISEGRNWNAAYDMGLTYLQMTPPRYEKAREAFRKTFDCSSPLSRYRGYEQSGICLVHMSQESDSKRNDHEKDAFEMFKRAIRFWGLCQKATPIFHNPNQHLHSLKSIRQLILGGEEHAGVKEVKEVADVHYCVREYGESLGLYMELKAELERSNDAKDLDIAKGIIKNNVKLGNFSDVLDLILILVNSREGFESKSFILEVLLEIIKCAISNENENLIKSVFDIYRHLTEYDGDDDDIVVIYEEETVGGLTFGWLQKLSGLKITKNDDNVPINHPRRTGQMELISNSEAVIFIITGQEKETTYLKYLVASALEAMHDKDRRLSKIIPITVNNCSLPSSLGAFKRLPYPRDNLNTDITSWLYSFCDILLSP
ncbi:hypothetical protein SNE40_015419 [Patella caerulea]|uniref:Uncharacterized protein n=1 Tax=Patella caerulea TaxID=87958 RepID=A0AAN8JGW9_PATCE